MTDTITNIYTLRRHTVYDPSKLNTGEYIYHSSYHEHITVNRVYMFVIMFIMCLFMLFEVPDIPLILSPELVLVIIT